MSNWTYPYAYWYTNTVDLFKNFVMHISTNMAKTQMVKTADTGQVDWKTITTRPNTGYANATMYEIYRFNDPLQATAPCFVKFQYGRDRDERATLYITMGTGSDGAGNLTSPVGPLSIMSRQNDGGINNTNVYWTSGVDYVGACFGVTGPLINQTNSGAYGHRFFIERTKSSTLISDGRGVICHGHHLEEWDQRGMMVGYGGVPNLVSPQLITQPFPLYTGGSPGDRTAWTYGKFQPRMSFLLNAGVPYVMTGILYCVPVDLNSCCIPEIRLGGNPSKYIPLWETYNNGESVNEAHRTCNFYGNSFYSGMLMRWD